MRTTNFATAKRLMLVSGISIAGAAPEHFGGPTYAALVPEKNLAADYKAGRITEWEFFEQYKVQLEALDAEKVYDELLDLVRNPKTGAARAPYLLCRCEPNAFCHRHLVASWLRDKGIPCVELSGDE